MSLHNDNQNKEILEEKKALIEALIFASRGIDKQTIKNLTNFQEDEIDNIISQIVDEYSSSSHGIELKEIEGYLRFYTKSKFSNFVSKVAKRRNLGSLSPAQLEVAIFLAVRKQATKLEIDSMRAKDSTNLIKQLLVSGVIKRRKSGRTFVYSLTDTFKDESMIEELVRQAGGASFESIAKNLFEPEVENTQSTESI
ncbi:MAG: SMC-Scp complex subunit ScpB [Fervidobacterium sp.]|nr:SMC-Scp complex subunit ScpB [Fervidobacterium sp.]